MIRFIAAIDSQRGIADDNGIPWQGKIPSDVKYYRAKVQSGGLILMGYGLYVELSKPYRGGINYVATQETQLKPGFEPVTDARAFITNANEDIWNLGGAGIFGSTFDLADELYLTRLNQDFHCTKFFPPFEKDFELASRSDPITENDITICFEVWRRKT